MNRNVTHNIAPLIRGGAVMLCNCYGMLYNKLCFAQNNAFSNASQLQGVRELRVKAEVMQTADRVKCKRLEVKT